MQFPVSLSIWKVEKSSPLVDLVLLGENILQDHKLSKLMDTNEADSKTTKTEGSMNRNIVKEAIAIT